MNEIIEILMRRDQISEEEAWSMVNQCQEELNYIIGAGGPYIYEEAEEFLADYLGLEPDYLIYFLS